MKDPFHAYPHSTGCQSLTGGAFVPNGAWPGYDGAYLYADFVCGRIFTLSASCGGQWASSVLADNAGPVVELQFVGDQLWYTSYNGQVRRIVPPPRPAGGSASRLVSIPPARKLDTRLGIGGPAGVVPAGGTRTVSLGPQVPPGAVAAVVNVTITQATAPGFVTAWPADKPRPFTSTLNVTTPGQTVPNTALVAVSTGRAAEPVHARRRSPDRRRLRLLRELGPDHRGSVRVPRARAGSSTPATARTRPGPG